MCHASHTHHEGIIDTAPDAVADGDIARWSEELAVGLSEHIEDIDGRYDVVRRKERRWWRWEHARSEHGVFIG